MSFKWPPKDPDEVLDYSVDWSRLLGQRTLLTCKWFIDNADGVKTELVQGTTVNGIQNVSQTISNDVTTINLGLGTLNKEYKFYCQITTSSGSVVERVIRLKIKEQ